MTGDQGFGSVDRQLGVIGAKLESIMEMMRQRSEQADKQWEHLAEDLRRLKHDHHTVQQKVETLGWRQDQLENRIADIRDPVETLMQTRTRLGGAMIVIASIGGSIWLMFEMIGRWLLDHFFGGRAP